MIHENSEVSQLLSFVALDEQAAAYALREVRQEEGPPSDSQAPGDLQQLLADAPAQAARQRHRA